VICVNCGYQPIFVHRNQVDVDITYCPQCGREDCIKLATPRQPRLTEGKSLDRHSMKTSLSKHEKRNQPQRRLRAVK
jgi:hypothetical protein